MQALIAQYGYLALLLGTVAEGETVLVLAGYAAHEAYLDLGWVVVVASLGGFAGDQAYFWMGRRQAPWVFRRFPALRARVDRVQGYLRRFEAWVIVGIRFMYGLRIAGPIVIGASGVSAWRFALLNGVGACLWAVLFASAGYWFGPAMVTALEQGSGLARIIAAVAGLVLAGLWWRRRRGRRPPS